MTEYEPVIGLEVHAQLITNSKMYCSCPADYQSAEPNSHVCPVCLGLPGTLPVINREAIKKIIMTGLALNCGIAEQTKFDRKNYPYPDLMKGYQISQFDLPICHDGYLDIEVDGETRRIGIERVHMEEDVAKLFHRTEAGSGKGYSLVDVNRAGVPLMEMVGRPDIRTAEEARQYLISYRSILQYLGVSTGSMEEGSFRCDANVSIRPKGVSEFGTKVEVKNMNSFRAVFRAIEFEIDRQTKVLNQGGRIVQETRGWVEATGETISLRSKEEANDYRFFPEPDLPPLTVAPSWVAEIAALLPELPTERRARFEDKLGLSPYNAGQLTASPRLADYYESVLEHYTKANGASDTIAKSAANWTITELGRLSNEAHVAIEESPLTPEHLAELISLIDKQTIGSSQAKTAVESMFNTGKSASATVDELGLAQITDSDAIGDAANEAISANPSAVADYMAGKETAAKFLVGQVMKVTRGKANPSIVSELIVEQLEALK
ncbi:MAG: Asp-tRNA(Asn)/Glu-tRNA(Gln) amidotransferase subunit GatB [Chloroflexi bacterium]|nr:Asp-tRNA(Asn)/Glu-tRNA(Gln) amidotransferase subunit GatB [Chloroflexota bacterium]